MPEFFDYDPVLGMRTTWDYDESTGDAKFRHEQDVEPLLGYTMEARNTRQYDGKHDYKFYCSIPPVVQIELRNKGIDIYSKDPSMIRLMLQTINKDYPYLKMTDKTHV